MTSLAAMRAAHPPPYPDHAVFLSFACARYGVAFEPLEPHGAVVRVGAPPRDTVLATTGRTCVYPLNTASAMALATDKHFTRIVLDFAGVANLGGEPFFLDPRRAALRPPGRERSDARAHLAARGFSAFCKPLAGSRGDFAERVRSAEGFEDWLARVSLHHDAIIVQDVFEGDEFRVFVVDDVTVYAVQRFAPSLRGDGVHTAGELLASFTARQSRAGLSLSVLPSELRADDVLPSGASVSLGDRRNASVGGGVRLVALESLSDVVALAQAARRALGLRVAGVDVMRCADGPRIVEVNANPAISHLEALDREDLVARVWGEVLVRMGLIDRV
jgi:hypothetical protein